jgi:alkanesulfonate monooxygenase SsuD/methylene tetrahydromethanopterin reductase-like flavin-dependent oxidoreductase (luciferase family)
MGVQVEPQFGFDYSSIVEIATVAEKNNFSHIWFSDHFFLNTKSTKLVSLDIWTVMSALATQTTKIRIGSMVLCNNYRHPAVLAKMISSLDHISGGRFDFGYGAGWKEVEYKAYGLPFPSAGIRIKQLAEGIEVITKLWTEEKATFSGEYYELNDAISFPKPFQKPHPPIWIGTMEAKPKMLKLISKYATGSNIAWAYTPAQVKVLKNKIDTFAREYGRKKPIKMSLGLWAALYQSDDEFEEEIKKRAKGRNVSENQVRERLKGSLHGTVDYWIKQLKAYHEIGVSHFIFMFPEQKEVESIKLVNERVIPYL